MATIPSKAKTSAADEQIQRLYGKLPSRAQLLNKKLQDRKYFDSGDYALSQAARGSQSQSAQPASGVANASTHAPAPSNCSAPSTALPSPAYFVGSRHPDPRSIPHNYSAARRGSTVTSSPPRRSSIITAGEV